MAAAPPANPATGTQMAQAAAFDEAISTYIGAWIMNRRADVTALVNIHATQ